MKRTIIAAAGVSGALAILIAAPFASDRVANLLPYKLATSAAGNLRPATAPAFEPPVEVLGENLGRRVILFHGLPGYEDYWTTEERRPLLDGFLSAGAQVVLIRLPKADQSMFRDGGEAYCAAFSDWLRQTLAEVTRAHGEATTTAAGISYGGYHAMLAASDPGVGSWAAIAPVTDLSRLPRYRFQSNSACRPDIQALARKPGIVAFGENDTVVGDDLIRLEVARIAQAGARDLTSTSHPAPDHYMSDEIRRDVLDWYAAQGQ